MLRADILIADDDETVVHKVTQVLEKEECTVRAANDVPSTLVELDRRAPDILLLDIAFTDEEPGAGEDGLALLKRIRSKSNVPVIMLTSVSVNMVKVYALTVGADDYLTKPFVPAELVARVKAVLRRTRDRAADTETIEVNGIRIDAGARQAWREGALLELTALEFDLLYALASRAGKVLSREQLITHAWRYDYAGDPRVVDVHIMNLRRRIEKDPGAPERIITVRGKGYRFETATDAAASTA